MMITSINSYSINSSVINSPRIKNNNTNFQGIGNIKKNALPAKKLGVLAALSSLAIFQKSTKKENQEIKSLDERCKLATKSLNKIPEYKALSKSKNIDTSINSKNIDLVEVFLETPELNKNENIRASIPFIIANINSSDDSLTTPSARCSMALSILQIYAEDPVLQYSKPAYENIGSIAHLVSENSYDSVFLAMDWLKSAKYRNSYEITDKVKAMLHGTIEPQATFSEEILKDEKLYQNKNLMDNFGFITREMKSDNEINFGIAILDKYLSDKKYYENKELSDNLGNILKDLPKQGLQKSLLEMDRLIISKDAVKHGIPKDLLFPIKNIDKISDPNLKSKILDTMGTVVADYNVHTETIEKCMTYLSGLHSLVAEENEKKSST